MSICDLLKDIFFIVFVCRTGLTTVFLSCVPEQSIMLSYIDDSVMKMEHVTLVAPLSHVSKTFFYGVANDVGHCSQPKLFHDPGSMGIDRPDTEMHGLSNFPATHSGSDKRNDPRLVRRERPCFGTFLNVGFLDVLVYEDL